jgi:hypothetical protein
MKTYDDVVEITGDDNEGGNVYDCVRDKVLDFDNGVNILVNELGFKKEVAEDWLTEACWESKENEDEDSDFDPTDEELEKLFNGEDIPLEE